MKLRQNLFLKKFLPVWGIIGMLFPLVVVMIFSIKGILEFLMLLGLSLSCALLSATIGWKCCLTHHWIPLSLCMSLAFLIVLTIFTLVLSGGDVMGTVMLMSYLLPILILPCLLLILAVNYLILRN